MEEIRDTFAHQAAWLQSAIGLVLLAIVAALANYVIKKVILRAAAPYMDERSLTVDKAAARLANVIPALIISFGVTLVPNLPEEAIIVVRNVARAVMVISIALAITGIMSYVNELYERHPDARTRPIKGYIQVGQIVLFLAAVIIAISTLIDQSPLLLSGLGAAAAVLLLVFKDTILSFVASVQLMSNDMLRVGDWIEMPQLNADGDVIDIALHTVKVQNFDKTITTIPTHRLISESFKNWRGMSESGGRRIKRALLIDQTSICFLEPDAVDELRRFRLLDEYLARKDEELREWNARALAEGRDPVNARKITNIGTFRAYVEAYLKAHEQVSKTKTLLVRQLDPGANGLPLEVYCFTDTVQWLAYESIQSDIFDHLLAIMPEFGLRMFQEPTGIDLREMRAG